MGKPFEKELGSVGDTLNWAVDYNLDLFSSEIERFRHMPLLVVGSGGSLSQAHFVVRLHETYTGNLAKAVTPLELVTSQIQGAAVIFLSAGGRNKDVLQAFSWARRRSWNHIGVFCWSKGSPLASLASKNGAGIVEVELPSGRDGFLATNSLLAGAVLFLRAYAAVTGAPVDDPDIRNVMVPSSLPITAEEVVRRNTVVALGAGWSMPAVVDLESKFVEAALGNVQMADLRNFAHGRHVWLAKREDVSGVVICQTPDESRLAERTMALIPEDIPRLVLATEKPGPIGTLELLTKVFRLVNEKGQQEGIDPGRPGVPSFGSQIYGLGMSDIIPRKPNLSLPVETWVARKVSATAVHTSATRDVYQRGLETFLHRLTNTKFRAVVCDYDGTLCDAAERFVGLRPDLVSELVRLLDNGLWIGIATGRGKSVAEALRKCLPQHLWGKVWIGYYNGGIVRPLCNDEGPTVGVATHPSIAAMIEVLGNNQHLGNLATLELRPTQISVQPKQPDQINLIRDILIQAVHVSCGVKVVESGHSWDLIPQQVSKLSVVRALEELCNSHAVLCLGDRGDEKGNDHELLSSPFSLSVDRVSLDPHTCWNLSTGGRSHASATLQYLEALNVVGESARFRLSRA